MNDAIMARKETKQARDFRRLIRKLFEIGPPTISLMGGDGQIRAVADFGGHKVLLGAFEGEEIDGVLRLAMMVRAASPGGFKSSALAEAFAASGPIEGGGCDLPGHDIDECDDPDCCGACGADLDDASKACADTAAAAMVRAEAAADA
jgi:hypothetical protein